MKTILTLIIVAMISGFAWMVSATSTGITGKTQKNGQGCNCHGSSASPGVAVSINGPATLKAGETGNYTVSISGGPLAAAGVNIATSSGTLTAGTGLRKISNELAHSTPKNPTSGSVTFDFLYTAPAVAGTVSLFATGNSVNKNGGTGGDQWNHAQSLTIDVSDVVSVKEESPVSFSLGQNYPNPFNPSTNVPFSLEKGGVVKVLLRDVQGRLIREMENKFYAAGSHTLNTDFSDLPSGTYLATLAFEGKTQTIRMMLVR